MGRLFFRVCGFGSEYRGHVHPVQPCLLPFPFARTSTEGHTYRFDFSICFNLLSGRFGKVAFRAAGMRLLPGCFGRGEQRLVFRKSLRDGLNLILSDLS